MAPMELTAMPLPSELQTPPVTTTKRVFSGADGVFLAFIIQKMGNVLGGGARCEVY